MKAARLGQEAVAAHIGVTPGYVSQLVTGRRPLPIDKAQKLAAYLNVQPGTICAAWDKLANQGGGNVVPLPVTQKASEGLRQSRIENDIDALRYALAAIISAMVIHRPAEALDVAAAIRKRVPAKFQQAGLIPELVSVLEKAQRT